MSQFISHGHVKALLDCRLQDAESRRHEKYMQLHQRLKKITIRQQLCAYCGLILLNTGKRLLTAARIPKTDLEGKFQLE